ncbi:hypothetical protein BX666DRAFT_1997377 [Dichotomocladium elegans]|nr:hypothetical protein BX666DRAFT_1997366 [Dichotomocladium elegans]KAI9311338.1 hypothetical protein BX666DRAFT_1997377 [Dichotomocladium elegans]
MFRGLDRTKFWRLSSGRYVEDIARNLAEDCKYEHPACSLIMDPSDPIWAKDMTEDERNGIKSFKRQSVSPLPDDLATLLHTYRDKKSFEEIEAHNIRLKYSPTNQPDHHWVKRSIDDCLNVLRINFFGRKEITEQDYMKRVWICIDKCFDGTDITVTSGESACKAVSDRLNAQRTIPCITSMERKYVGAKMDLLFRNLDYELGVAEAKKSRRR